MHPLIKVLIALYLGANFLFSTSAVFGTDWWDKAYFLYQDTAGAGWLVWVILYKVSEKPYRTVLKPLVIFSIGIFVWDIISYITDWGVNNPTATGIAFGAATMIVAIFMLKDLIRQWKS